MTQYYAGRKTVLAWPQVSTKDGSPGYAVKYDHGYISWSPADVFEKAYVEMGHLGSYLPHQIRVAGERAVLVDDIDKLSAFLQTPGVVTKVGEAEYCRLVEQLDTMIKLAQILAARIAAF